MEKAMTFTEEQLQRYSRQILLPEVGGKGQRKLAAARVFLVGAGGLGSPAALYLAAAGVGTIGIIDNDTVDLSNLQRQILHDTPRVGQSKALSAAETIRHLNPDVRVVPHVAALTADNAAELIADYDIVLDGSDNFSTRFLVNDAAFFQKKTLISGSIFRFEGQVATLKPHDPSQTKPCYRCLYAEPPPSGMVPSCQEAGVLGVLAGTIGVLQAAEALKEILGIGETLAGRLLVYDALDMTMRTMKVPKNPACALCGDHPTITDLRLSAEPVCALPV